MRRKMGYNKRKNKKGVVVMGKQQSVLNRLFTQYVFDDLMQNHENKVYGAVVKRYVNDAEAKNNGEIISEIYHYMSKQYRNEYFYQNTLINKLLLGRHSINTTTALTQIPIGKSKADFILINGKAVVYEIKTELDNLERLSTQLEDYYKAFNHVCVVTCEENGKKLCELLEGSAVGVYVLTRKNTIRYIKKPICNNNFLQYKEMFKVLHKKEFENILLTYYKKTPECPPVFYYDECFSWFKNIPQDTAYSLYLQQLKKRNKIVAEQFDSVPYELKSLFYFHKQNKTLFNQLTNFLRYKYGGN